jgi:Stage II sporulation protein M
MALAQGMRDTRGALVRWNGDPVVVLRPWFLGALAFAAGLLAAVLLVASVARPDVTPLYIPGIAYEADLEDVVRVIFRNGLVLALHAVACVAGFIAGSSLPLQASQMHGWRRWIHEKARPLAFAWIVAVTCFSLVTQAYVLGSTGAQLAEQFQISPALLMLTVFPHAILELTAVFLPLAAWTIASRREEWQDLLAATFATVAVALPILVIAASWETFVWPRLLEHASPVFGF